MREIGCRHRHTTQDVSVEATVFGKAEEASLAKTRYGVYFPDDRQRSVELCVALSVWSVDEATRELETAYGRGFEGTRALAPPGRSRSIPKPLI